MTNNKKKRILVIDDDATMREIYKDMFSDAADKYEIETEADAGTALQKTQAGAFDLVVLDMIMEPMDGETFYKYMKENVKTKSMPVIVISVLEIREMEDLKKLDHIHFLEKPITQEQLLGMVGSVLRD